MNKFIFKLQIPIALGICSALAVPAHADVTANVKYHELFSQVLPTRQPPLFATSV